jgi:hypothetical protein
MTEALGRESVSVFLRYAVVALVFAVCGACTAKLVSIPQPHGADLPRALAVLLLAVVPFAGCCLLFSWVGWRGLFEIPLMCTVWLLALLSAGYVAYRGVIHADRYGICLGGFIGGIGSVLCSSLSYKRLLSWKYIIAGGAIGLISAVPLAWGWGHRNFFLILEFAIWQIAVGMYLYVVRTRANRDVE